MKILVATRNKGKIREIEDLLKDVSVEWVSMDDFPDIPDVEEDGETFEENALKKARTLAEETGLVTIADDSGLVVDALNGRPSVWSARYAGENASDQDKYLKILAEMREIPDPERTARFVCVIALKSPKGYERIFSGKCEGIITHEPHGSGGFGYDPIFFFPPLNRAFGELDRETKNTVSHRANALEKLIEHIRSPEFEQEMSD
jgi:XTP/dITP diphosphohydrolase